MAISCFYDWVKVHCWVWWFCGVCYSRLQKPRFIQVLCHLQLVHSCRQAPTVFNVASLVYLSCPLVELAAATWWQQSVLWSSVAVVVLGTLAFAMVAFWGIPSSSHLYRSDRAGWKFWQLKLQDLKIFRKNARGYSWLDIFSLRLGISTNKPLRSLDVIWNDHCNHN